MEATDQQALLYDKLVQTSIEHHDYENAIFLAERFVACYPQNPRATYLHAKAYFHSNRHHVAYRILEGQNYLLSKYLFARCCIDLDELQEGEQALRYIIQTIDSSGSTIGELELEHVYCLLGKICRRAGKKGEAIKAFKKALELCPFLWNAHQNLCELGSSPEAGDAFQARLSGRALPSQPHKSATRRKRLRDGASKSSGRETTETNENGGDGDLVTGDEVIEDLRGCGQAYSALCRYECRETLKILSGLGEVHLRTGWALTQVARSYYEMAKYPEAARFFREARELEPWRAEGLDLFGSCLWHLKEEAELAYLAKEMESTDRLAPQTWCIVGNLYSLRQEHEMAIKCFGRAIQLNPYFQYAYTLTGFEYKMKEDYDRAVTFFQKAIRIDPRPFNAWFGLGEIYYQQQNYKASQFHYEKALSINPKNPIIHFHLGTILQKLGQDKSLGCFETAVALEPKNALYRFRLAYALALSKRYEDALRQLNPLETFTHIESNVYLLMGKIYKELGDNKHALLAYSKARDHRSARHDLINEALDNLYSLGDDTDLSDLFKHLD
ncbi:anaphase promoting complex subunit CDC27 [Spizellomyces punctatus DAOM BR117]|uniref:Uncharacterized protein n=1 Tax=Spizellomyces punctatus (strain DAOM BR117) TaxID=645134 RepID=A0A0L0HMY3_SPIPD|nr:anaphase promoting complex subunit CDC27 [Spizellomyces punctatus DAOM BR117]KND02285.1 hypothetical protein SPPG_02761 [Spizellomyces punctatus DAOM BR117]|eukprot:XP_016610324.1 hypothetical protein SPPG_02761 [Spizellomyces punctatus DAOM BR117]